VTSFSFSRQITACQNPEKNMPEKCLWSFRSGVAVGVGVQGTPPGFHMKQKQTETTVTQSTNGKGKTPRGCSLTVRRHLKATLSSALPHHTVLPQASQHHVFAAYRLFTFQPDTTKAKITCMLIMRGRAKQLCRMLIRSPALIWQGKLIPTFAFSVSGIFSMFSTRLTLHQCLIDTPPTTHYLQMIYLFPVPPKPRR